MAQAQTLPANTAIHTGDRLTFTLFVAAALHAMVVFGVSFTLPDEGEAAPTLDVTLATHKEREAPEEADYLAQHNQQASGTEEQARQLTTDQQAEFADTQVREINPAPQTRASRQRERRDQTVVTTTGESQQKQPSPEEADPQEAQKERDGLVEDRPLLSREIASLQAKLERQRQEYAKRPRIRRLTSVATRSSYEAEYLYDWSQTIERTGNRHYPQQALEQRLTGSLRLSVSIKPDGSLHDVEVLASSGHRVLDQAALQIVHMAAPFERFPPELRGEFDRLEIIRTWNFEINGLSTSAE